MWKSVYREQIEPDFQKDSFESDMDTNVHLKSLSYL